MKKTLCLVLCIALLAFALGACAQPLPDYKSWTLSQFQAAETREQERVMLDIAKELNMGSADDDTMYDLGFAVGVFLGQGQTIGQAVEAIRKDPSLIETKGGTVLPADYQSWGWNDYVDMPDATYDMLVRTIAAQSGVEQPTEDQKIQIFYLLHAYLYDGGTVADVIQAIGEHPAYLNVDKSSTVNRADYNQWTIKELLSANLGTWHAAIESAMTALALPQLDYDTCSEDALDNFCIGLVEQMGKDNTIGEALQVLRIHPEFVLLEPAPSASPAA